MEKNYQKVFPQIVRRIKLYNKDLNESLLEKAYQFSFMAHKDQIRKSGEPYFEHPLEVAKILVGFQMDTNTICGGLLHDVVEDTGITIEEIQDEFNEEIAVLVDGVTKISGINFENFETQQAENFRKMIISMVRDIRVILIKFADRLHNMRTIEYLPEKKQQRIAVETRDVYAPLAHRLGLTLIEAELEDTALRILDRKSYDLVLKKILQDRPQIETYVQKIRIPIRRELKKLNITDFNIQYRPKHIYSIYDKMIRRKLPYEEIYDSFTILMIFKKIAHCYFALGVVHNLFTPVHERFKDFIATPKSNMYQSLHTTVIGPDKRMLGIQIRTEEMNTNAEMGIIAQSKNGKGKHDFHQNFLWLRKLLEWHHETKEPGDFFKNLKDDLFYDEVFVFTPKGDLHRLPRGSTPVDFAFSIHTDIGYHCIGAKVNRKVVPLNYRLRSGDMIEIITSDKLQPNPEWIKFVKTAKARSKIERWIRDTKFDQSIGLGKQIIKVECKKAGYHRTDEGLMEIAQTYGLDDVNQLYMAVGKGEIPINEVIKKFKSHEMPNNAQSTSILNKLIHPKKSSSNSIKIQGVDNFLISFGKCCQPIPGDRILGFITKGSGVVIHRADCKFISDLLQNPDTNISVEWDVDKDKRFFVKLKILAYKRNKFLNDVSESITDTNTNIVNMDLATEDSFINTKIVVQVKNLNQLTRIISKMQNIDGVISVERLNGEA